jgi:hypothetical protein
LSELISYQYGTVIGQRSTLPKTTYIKDPAMYFDVLTSDGQEVQDVSFVRDEMVRLQWVN